MAHTSHTKSSVSIDLFNLPPLSDPRRQFTVFCDILNDFLLPDRKNSRLSQIINTWTFGRLPLDGNESVGVKISYLEHTYGTKNYVIDQVNGQINAIHDNNIELTEFTGHFSPFYLDELELKVCQLADHLEDEDVYSTPQQPPKQPVAPQAQESDTNSGLQSIEDLTSMGFCSPNYSPIPPVRNTAQQQPRVTLPTSTPITDRGLGLNTSDLTHNRGKAKIVNSFTEPQEPPKKSLKGGKVKSSQGAQPKNVVQPSTSSHNPSDGELRPLVHCPACGGDHLRKDCCCDTFCTRCRSRSHNTDMCCAPTDATLIELANIQSRSIEMMATSERSQQEAFHQLIKASKDKANDAMFTSIKTYDGKNRQVFRDWIDEIDQACQVSNCDFGTEIIKKLTGAVQQVVMACENYSDNTLLAKLRGCFSDASTMNEAKEELRIHEADGK